MKFKDKMKALKLKSAQVYIAMKSEATPWYAKVMAGITIMYALSPIDLIPDFIPILGYLDDLVILPVLIWITMKLISKDIWDSYEDEAKYLLEKGLLKKWYYAIPIIIIWLILIGLVIWLIIK